MEPTERWSKRPHSTITQRNVDKELQRIKSLAVVSVLNKSFNKEPGAPLRSSSLAPIPSPSSSLTTENENFESSSTNTRSRSLSVHSSANDSHLKKKSNTSLYNEYIHDMPIYSKGRSNSFMSISSGQGIFDSDQIALAEKETNPDSLVINSQVDTEKENLIKRVQELQALYDASIKDLQVAEERSNTQSELVVLQDRLIQNMSNELECLTTETSHEFENNTIDLETAEGKHLLETTQQELASISKDISDMKSLKTHYESIITDMTRQLSLYEDRIDEMESTAKRIQKEHSSQVEFIDTKVQTLVQKLLETNETINRLQVEHIQEKQALLAKQQELINYNSSIKSINDSSSVIWETSEEKEDIDGTASTRSSFISTSPRTDNQQRKSFIARWKGSAMPPASPPPSSPLPPIPTSTSRSSSRPKSTLSEIYTSSSTSTLPQHYKHISVDAVGGVGRRTSSVQSDLDTEITDAAYYKEFTDQLQERLSVSKEIDDLTVWTPSDYDLIQKKIESKRWSSGSDDGSQRDQTAFWKGMKKKLRV